MPLRRAPTSLEYVTIEGGDYADLVDEEIAALWNYVGMPLVNVSGTSTAIEADSIVPLIADPVEGQHARLVPTLANDEGGTTIDIDGRGPAAILTAAGEALPAGALRAGVVADLTHDGTDWRLPDASAWHTVRKVATQTKASNTTLAADTELVVPLKASRTYHIRGRVFIGAPATPGFKYSFSGPASPTAVRFETRRRDPNTTTAVLVGGVAFPGSTAITGNATSNGYIEFSAIVENGANDGDFEFNWAQNVSNATASSVYAGSYIEWLEV